MKSRCGSLTKQRDTNRPQPPATTMATLPAISRYSRQRVVSNRPQRSKDMKSNMLRKVINGIKGRLTGAAIFVALSAAPTYADGWVTMHGTACKASSESNSAVTYGNELWTGDSSANVVCPLV